MSADNKDKYKDDTDILNEMMDMLHGVPIKDRRYRFRTYKRCFVANECVEWISKHLYGAKVTKETRLKSVKLLQQFVSKGWIQHVVDKKKAFQDAYLFFIFTKLAQEQYSKHHRSLSTNKLDSLQAVLKSASDPIDGVVVKNRTWRLKSYKKCFIASEFIDWCIKNLRLRTRQQAIELANRFVANGSIRHVVHAQPLRDEYLFFEFVDKTIVDDSSNKQVTLEDFETLKLLGVGGFGKVILSRKKSNGKIYAIKAMEKARMSGDRELKNLQSELEILKNDHSFLVHLYWSFQDDSHIYLVLDYLAGGDMFFHLQKYKQGFSSEVSKFFVAEIILALEYLHACGVVYRDLKLENILLDGSGHVCLTDFGLSKSLGDSDRTETMCGTPGYLAPEILSGKPYSIAVDYWSLGVLMFEISSGLNPFLAESTHKTLQNILHKKIIFPPSMFSKDAISFMEQLLVRDPDRRLINPDEMKKHPYFKGIDWSKLLVKKLKSPYSINLNSETDTSHFDSVFTKQDVDISLTSQTTSDQTSSSNSTVDEFAGFDYVAPDAGLL